MMLKRRTLLLLVSAIALLGVVLLFEGNRSLTTNNNGDPSTESGLSSDESSSGELMFPFAEEDVSALTVERPADTVAFEKSEQGIWQMSAPETGLAEPGAIAFLLTQITNPSANTLTVPANDLSDFGLDNPTATVSLTANESTYQLTVGGTDFTGDQRYVQAIDSEAEADDTSEVKIHLVSGGFDNAVNRPTSDWLATEASDDSDETEPIDE